MTDPKEIIIKILEIIDFEEDKEEYAKKFIQVCEEQAILELLKGMSDEKREELAGRVTEENTDKENSKILKEYFSEKDYSQALESASERVFRDYLDTIEPTLSPEQKEKLEKFLDSISR